MDNNFEELNVHDDCNIKNMIKTFLELLKPNDFDCDFGYNNLKKRYRKVDNIFKLDDEYIGYTILFDKFEKSNGRKKFNNNGIEIISQIIGKYNIFNETYKCHGKIEIIEETLNNFLEILGRMLYDSEYCYHVTTTRSKIYGNLIIPLFYNGEYVIEKSDTEIEEHENVKMINSNFVKYNVIDMDPDLKFVHYKVLNPFGFDKDSINYKSIYGSYNKNGMEYKNISLNLSDKAKEGLLKVIISYPY